MQLELDVSKIKTKDMRALERAKQFGTIVEWLVKFAGADEKELDELTLLELMGVAQDVGNKINESLLPKANGSSSSSS